MLEIGTMSLVDGEYDLDLSQVFGPQKKENGVAIRFGDESVSSLDHSNNLTLYEKGKSAILQTTSARNGDSMYFEGQSRDISSESGSDLYYLTKIPEKNNVVMLHKFGDIIDVREANDKKSIQDKLTQWKGLSKKDGDYSITSEKKPKPKERIINETTQIGSKRPPDIGMLSGSDNKQKTFNGDVKDVTGKRFSRSSDPGDDFDDLEHQLQEALAGGQDDKGVNDMDESSDEGEVFTGGPITFDNGEDDRNKFTYVASRSYGGKPTSLLDYLNNGKDYDDVSSEEE